MTTLTATRLLTVVRTCTVCNLPSTEAQGLVLEVGGYVHALCSTRHYDLVTVVSFPDDNDPDPEPTTPAPATLVTGPELCEDCRLYAPTFEDYCDDCQAACNEWDSDHAPDYDVLYERHRACWEIGLVVAA